MPSVNSANGNPKINLKPLKITCTSTQCGNNLHCFKQKGKIMDQNLSGRCRSCGISLVDWQRLHLLDVGDINYTFNALKHELIRHHFWHIEIDQKAINHALRKGKTKLRQAAEHRIRRSVGDAEPIFDGRQTPKSGNSIFYAQHATATCCRKCIEYWHGIPLGQELTEDQIQYFAKLVMLYIEDRLPQLKEEGIHVPKISSRKEKKEDSFAYAEGALF